MTPLDWNIGYYHLMQTGGVANGCACVQNIAAENESVTLAEHVTHCRRDDIINVLIEYVTPLRLEHRIFSSSLICEAKL